MTIKYNANLTAAQTVTYVSGDAVHVLARRGFSMGATAVLDEKASRV
jgi:hypothetical protein